jgi:cell division initiation protein
MKMTPNEIEKQQFKIKFRGFDIREVDEFIENVTEAFRALSDENSRLHRDIIRLKKGQQEHREREETFTKALNNSHKVLEKMKDNARKSAELIIADAEGKAERILNRAYNRLSQLHEDISELKRQRVQIQMQIRSTLDTHTKLLDMGEEEMQAMDEKFSKVKILKKAT